MKKANRIIFEELQKCTTRQMTRVEAEAIIDSLEKLSVLCCEMYYMSQKTNIRIIELNEDEKESRIAA
jgi:hypothetical protein